MSPIVEGEEQMLNRRLPADACAVAGVRREAYTTCRGFGASDEDCTEFDLALGEALANAVSHGALDGKGTTEGDYIRLSVWRYDDVLIASVHNQGPGFDPPDPPYVMPAAGTDNLRGRGLPLMEMLTDALLVTRGDVIDGGAFVYLVKRVGSQYRTSAIG